MNPEKHVFAIYTELLKPQKGNQSIVDEDLVHRIKNILRLREGEHIIFFNGRYEAKATIESYKNKTLFFVIDAIQNTEPIKPEIVWILPILERESFEQALTFLAVVGVTSVQPLITEKSRRSWGSPKDYERAQKMLIAGCEQAKQFVLPKLLPVKEFSLLDWATLPHTKLFFDPQGEKLFNILQQIKLNESICCFVGPEGDLTQQEKELLKKHQFQFCALTQTILKAVDAVTVVACLLRSLLE
jgi:16S rRNA (uracil1498-N3)-methyltransferase